MDLEPLFFLVIVMEYCPEGDLSSRIADAYVSSASLAQSANACV